MRHISRRYSPHPVRRQSQLPQRVTSKGDELDLKGFSVAMHHDYLAHVPFHQSLVWTVFHQNDSIQFLNHGRGYGIRAALGQR